MDEFSRSFWWHGERERLISLANDSTPLYVYSRAEVVKRASRLLEQSNLDRVFYAIKANSNKDLLQVLHGLGVGFECVSPGEIDYVLSLFPDLIHRDPLRNRVLFTPNFASRKEFEYAFGRGTLVTIDNVYALEHWAPTFAGKAVNVRVDPLLRRGHHEHVKTAGKVSKFGVPDEDLPRVAELAKEHSIRVMGLHAHVGSGILAEVDTWSRVADILGAHLALFPDVSFIDLGGGLGVPQKPGDKELDVELVNSSLAAFKARHPAVQLWMEPGRYIIATSGVLLATVTQLKQKQEGHIYIGANTGFNSLVRPILYGAYHHIVNLSRLREDRGDAEEDRVRADVVGFICESGDVLGKNRQLGVTKEGDVLLFACCGAYGRSMASAYNMREPAKEVVL